ncbi:hypothetical protein QYM36_009044 [Artemia franciscana]|uniref:Uncharacterized protein n=1 Tax=Artemia franciscana TaxID=6661 RepID=A0AA88HP75_ARTSF|nr:hypothetical protein QYM36_009044 [Artemia franciscana]
MKIQECVDPDPPPDREIQKCFIPQSLPKYFIMPETTRNTNNCFKFELVPSNLVDMEKLKLLSNTMCYVAAKIYSGLLIAQKLLHV